MKERKEKKGKNRKNKINKVLDNKLILFLIFGISIGFVVWFLTKEIIFAIIMTPISGFYGLLVMFSDKKWAKKIVFVIKIPFAVFILVWWRGMWVKMSKEDIYSTVPNEHIEEMPEELKDKLSNYLKSYKGKFFKAMPLAQAIGYPTKGTQVELRKAITELIEEQKLPIVSNPKGFTWATCSNMIKFYLEALQNRKQGLERRIKSVNQIYHDMLEQEQEVEEMVKIKKEVSKKIGDKAPPTIKDYGLNNGKIKFEGEHS